MKVGDLICYNACGMKYKTVGLVLQIDPPHRFLRTQSSILVQWCLVGKWMPRIDHRDGGWNDAIKPGQMIWHTLGEWFEVSK